MLPSSIASLRRAGACWLVSRTAIFVYGLAVVALLHVGCDPASSSTSTAESEQTGSKPEPSASSGAEKGADQMMSKPADNTGGDDGHTITDAQLERFADALERLEPKRKKLKKTMDQVDSIAEEKKARMKVMKAVGEAVDEAGLDLKVFQQISQRLKRGDEQLQARLREIANSS